MIKQDKLAKFYNKKPNRFTASPNRIMIHSLGGYGNPYQYITEVGEGSHGKVNYHICFNTDDNQYYKVLPDGTRGWHAGSRFNYNWYSICLAAFQMEADDLLRLREVLDELRESWCQEKIYLTLHRMVDPNKKDPLSFFMDEIYLIGARGPYLIPQFYRSWGRRRKIWVPAWEVH